MAALQVVSPTEYRTARLDLLTEEKAFTKARDELAAKRRALPVLEVTKPYHFTAMNAEGVIGQVPLQHLFDGRRQLIIYHFMFDPAWESGCLNCSVLGDSVPAHLQHLHARNTTFVAVSRAPIEKIVKYKKRMGWTFPWVSSHGSDFNFDFQATQDESVQPVEYNYKNKDELVKRGFSFFTKGEQPGHSCFFMGGGDAATGEKGKIYHTYSTYSRGSDQVVNTNQWLEMTKLGRQDEIEDKRWDEYQDEELKRL